MEEDPGKTMHIMDGSGYKAVKRRVDKTQA
jgi:hypothetical protein